MCNRCRQNPNAANALGLLDKFKQRATYAAFHAVTGGNKQTEMGFHDRSPLHSWIVAKKTGEPTGYPKAAIHQDLRARPRVIADPSELRRWLRNPS